MKFDLQKHKSYIIAGVVLLLVVFVVSFIIFRPSNKEEIVAEETEESKPEQIEVIPTVDASVKVDIEGIDNNTSILLKVENAPKGTEEVEASITYERKESGLDEPVQDGSFQVIEIEDGAGEVEILLGTESSGVKRYHKLIDGKIRVEMKFSGDYGGHEEKVYQGSFELDM
jgi:hypothetical protein